MKRLFLIAALLIIGLTSKAQYYNSYLSASAIAGAMTEANEKSALDNIRFDGNAIRQNPEAWVNYKSYLETEKGILRKYKIYGAVTGIGLGTMCSCLVPFMMWAVDDIDTPRYNETTLLSWTIGLGSVGTVMSIVGAIGIGVQLSKYKTNKKEFIYYLKTSNNGIGIVTIF